MGLVRRWALHMTTTASLRGAFARRIVDMTQRTNAVPELDRDLRFIPLGVEEPRVLTPTQVRRYNEAGHLFPIDFFSLGRGRRGSGLHRRPAAPGAGGRGGDNYQVVNWHKCCRGIWDIVTDSRVIDVVSDLLGDTVVLRHSHLFAKLPGDPKRVSWHQDASYWPLTSSRVVTAWLAIDDTDVDNSAMHVIRRLAPPRPTHLPRQHRHREQRAGPNGGQRRRLRRRAGRPGDAGGSDLHCTATGSCTALNPTGPTAAAAG